MTVVSLTAAALRSVEMIEQSNGGRGIAGERGKSKTGFPDAGLAAPGRNG